MLYRNFTLFTKQFYFEEVQDIINEYLVDALKPSTCLFFRDLGRLYSLENVVIETEKCLKEEFHQVSVQSDFCKLEIAELECLLSSDEITVPYITLYG